MSVSDRTDVNGPASNGAPREDAASAGGVDDLLLITQMFDLVFSFAKSSVLRTVVDLHIADVIAKAGGELSVDEIAAKLPGDTVKLDYLSRVMTFAALNGIFTMIPDGSGKISEGGKRCFGLTPISTALLDEASPAPEASSAHMARFQLSRPAAQPWEHFSDAILSGKEPFLLANGKGPWELGKADPAFGTLMNKAMAHTVTAIVGSVLKSYPGFAGVKTLVDVGGGLGASLAAIRKVYPEIQGINFDLPHVITDAPEISGVKHVGGDMFKSVPEGDAIYMKWIMHDWEDGQCVEILKNCFKSLPATGKVIIVDHVLPDPGVAHPNQYLPDIIMLAHSSGRERTDSQWRELLTAADFKRVEIITVPFTGVIEGYKS